MCDTEKKRERRFRVDLEEYPDHSWLEQDHYSVEEYAKSPCYLSGADMDARRDPIAREDYVDPENHPQAVLFMEERCSYGHWHVVDSVGGIDYYTGPGSRNAEPPCGTYARVEDLPDEYLRELAQDFLREAE